MNDPICLKAFFENVYVWDSILKSVPQSDRPVEVDSQWKTLVENIQKLVNLLIIAIIENHYICSFNIIKSEDLMDCISVCAGLK